MRDLSLHILDTIENSIRAGASTVAVSVSEDLDTNWIEIRIEDNGPGLTVDPDTAADPFYTTKRGKRTGLGLSLFRAATEAAAGTLSIGKSELGGLAVIAAMQLNHIDRKPLGDLAATFSVVILTNPALDLRCVIRSSVGETVIHAAKVAAELADSEAKAGVVGPLAVARAFSRRVKAAQSALRA